MRLSKDFTFWLSKDFPEDFHKITQCTHLLKIDHLMSVQDGFVLFSSPFQVRVSAYDVILCSLLKLLVYFIFDQSSASMYIAWHPDIKATPYIFGHLPVVCVFISFGAQQLSQSIRTITKFLFCNFR